MDSRHLFPCLSGSFYRSAARYRQGDLYLRQVVTGLDQIALSMAVFALAVLISLGKSGLLSRWLGEWPGRGQSSS